MVRLTHSFFFLACLVSATVSTPTSSPNFHTVSFSKKVSGKTRSTKALLARDLSRFNPDAAAAVGEAPATNEDDTYVVATQVGTQTFELIVDTGSSNTWVGSGTRYTPGSTSTNTGKSFAVTYGSGSVSGTEFTDSVSLGGLTVSKQSIGDGTRSSGFQGVDGIIGFGPVALTQGTVSGSTTVPTFLDNLRSQGTITTEVLGVSFAPESGSDEDDTNGELTLGGTDATKFSGSLTFVSKTTASPFNEFWGITVSSITYNGASVGGSSSAISSTYRATATTAYNAFLSASGGRTDATTGLASWTTLPKANFAFTIGGVSLTLTPAQFTVPTAQYADFGLATGKFYGWIADGGSVAADINFIIGQKFLENYYSVFDTTNNRVGFATRA
ncbi:Aspartic protease [Mycena sanguinolenta]|uniref:Aspartic protease n=1 Tax=Mycena sanguinolenta TaxID=230812 RepID=A0A8H7CKN5_9AGAR|nr:Aspartic protease [Mycena sanguinolenta]